MVVRRGVGNRFGRVSTTILALALALGAQAGCKKSVGGGPGEGGSGQGGDDGEDLSPEDFYVKYVHAELNASCGGCHTSDAGCFPQFMEAVARPSYNVIRSYPGLVTFPDNSNLLYHGAHTGPPLTLSQEALIIEWLELETKGKEEPALNLRSAIGEFGQCMQYEGPDSWTELDVYYLAFQQTAGLGPCYACHKTGEAGTWIDSNEERMWDMNTKLPYIKRIVQPVYDDNNELVDLQPSNRFKDKVEGPCGGDHPTALINDQNEAALESYFNATYDRWQAGNCQ